ncbi:alpha/beta fold hydrolase [Vagococcus sp. CY52-2]|uniref:alpha/beta fold hydrolase n=1 Tax=Vagococcus sp. CY52-2 TaxID=2925838 RepID=UPI001F564F02|nr:alpha/beta hydrolase [Vagococcus sp. CY52-2]UNM90172.1 alpha/beta hydrolase [Vagococcus sp. CY52-2]
MEKIVSSTDGSHIFYKILGHGSPIFFIHGNSGSHHAFQKQVDAFQKDHQLILMDTRDHGKSTNESNQLDFPSIFSDILAILDNEQIEKTTMIGFSDGANIALSFANYYPERVSKMVLISPNIRFDQLKKSKQLLYRSLYAVSEQLLRLKKGARVLRLAMKNLPLTTNYREKLKMPILFIFGDKDIIDLNKMAPFIDSLKQAKMVVLDKTGHSILKTRPLLVNKEISSFI